MVLGQLFLWKMQLDWETLAYDFRWGSSLFLFQAAGFVFLFSASKDPVYLTFLSFPIVGANLFFMETSTLEMQENSKKALSFLGIIVLLSLASFRLNALPFKSSHALAFIFIFSAFFLSWSASWAGRIEQRNLIHSIFRRFRRGSSEQTPDPDERLFYHDLINHLHGIGLFLESYSHRPSQIEQNHVQNLLQELQMTQKMVEDFFNWPHKNKINVKTGLAVTLFDLRPLVEHYLDIYCRSQGMEVAVEWKGDLAANRPVMKQKECSVHGHAFVRIITNVLKNIYDGGSPGQVFVTFEGEARHLFVLIKNSKFNSTHDLSDSRELANLILKNAAESDGPSRGDGHGLDSIDELCHRLGGQFKFFLEDGWWHTQINLPYFCDSPSVSDRSFVDENIPPKKSAA